MHEIGGPSAPAAGRLEDLLKVAALPVVDDIQNPVGLPVLEPPLNRGEVGRGVEKSPVGLADEQRRILLSPEKHTHRSPALASQPAGLKVRDHPRKQGLKETLPQLVVEGDAKPPVEPLDFGHTDRHELFPEPTVLGIAGVEPGRLGEHVLRRIGVGRRECRRLRVGRQFLRLGIGHLPHEPVEPAEFRRGIGRIGGIVAAVLPAPEDHAELSAPVAEVVVGDHPVATKPEDSGQRVTDHSGPDMAHVHRLGHVG